MAARSGYSGTFFVLDVSPSMGELKADPIGSGKVPKLTLAKEYIARRWQEKVLSKRKTELVGLVTCGGRTYNEKNAFEGVACEVACQTAKPKCLEVLMNLDVGDHEGNRESSFDHDLYDSAVENAKLLDIKLTIVGVDFDVPPAKVDKSKSRNKRLSEKVWRMFVDSLQETHSKKGITDLYPSIHSLDDALDDARRPHPQLTAGSALGLDIYIGDQDIDPAQAIIIPVKTTKATAKATAPKFSKAWKPAMDLQAPLRAKDTPKLSNNRLFAGIIAKAEEEGRQPPSFEEMSGMVSSTISRHTTYLLKKEEKDPNQTQTLDVDQEEEEEEEEEEYVPEEEISQAWKFGSTWIPTSKGDIMPLAVKKGIYVLGFVPTANIKQQDLMNEVKYIWPEITKPKAQIQFSALVEALVERKSCAIVRWVNGDKSEPMIGAAWPKSAYTLGKCLLIAAQLPFAEDVHIFGFPSLTTYKTSQGKVIEKHPLLPTEEQCDLMDELVKGMDLDDIIFEWDEESLTIQRAPTWFNPEEAVNPSIHRVNEAIFHASLTADLDQDPLGAPHPEIVKYFNTPAEVGKKVEDVTERLKELLAIRKVPPKMKKKKNQKQELGEGEGYIDDDALLENGEQAGATTKPEPISQPKADSQPGAQTASQPKPTVPTSEPTLQGKSKPGRIISNGSPIADFRRVIKEGDVFRKAIQDMGEVVRENVAASFSRQAFPVAIECLALMRETALGYEEVETYNEYVESLEKVVKGAGFKHPNFWQEFEKAGQSVSKISEEEAEAALNGED
ncbi:hypothetical protein L198_02331 [Cryptococcus wingfieldii CBS 7118]|uniref:ATP-dependent DNA helicase II subunit 2 n=1 Tax=Cryptococcus wingfieldii CBS 7118 TaxID=1295528 RepID=A0A1E3JRJ5_9TREE|nr:hypothetical protein L198_02331 [Cryptococcus wingfieldii CBS 7118]ODO03484.1 hypothetical protein L198_02331 [Cryptococcus wingfieldii CBS 7118]